MQAWSPRRFSHVYKHSREATGGQDLAPPGAVRAAGREAGGPDGARLGHPGLEGAVMGLWSPCSPAAQGKPWTERRSSESQRPVRAGHRAPRYSHLRSLPPPWGPPDTLTADAIPHPRGPPDTPRADTTPEGPQTLPEQRPPATPGGPPDTPRADATPPGAQLQATSRVLVNEAQPLVVHLWEIPTRAGLQVLPGDAQSTVLQVHLAVGE